MLQVAVPQTVVVGCDEPLAQNGGGFIVWSVDVWIGRKGGGSGDVGGLGRRVEGAYLLFVKLVEVSHVGEKPQLLQAVLVSTRVRGCEFFDSGEDDLQVMVGEDLGQVCIEVPHIGVQAAVDRVRLQVVYQGGGVQGGGELGRAFGLQRARRFCRRQVLLGVVKFNRFDNAALRVLVQAGWLARPFAGRWAGGQGRGRGAYQQQKKNGRVSAHLSMAGSGRANFLHGIATKSLLRKGLGPRPGRAQFFRSLCPWTGSGESPLLRRFRVRTS